MATKGYHKAITLFITILLGLGLMMGPAVAQETKAFEVQLTWVVLDQSAVLESAYEYQFQNAATGKVETLDILPPQTQPAGEGPFVLTASNQVALPASNEDGTGAVYLLSPLGSGYVVQDGIHFAVSTSEAQDPAAGSTYYTRARILTQQLFPTVQVEYRGLEPQPFDLTLLMDSWAMDSQGSHQHQASVQVSELTDNTLNLFDVFLANPDDAVLFRHFVLAELAWDGSSIAGQNQFTLQVGDVEGASHEVTGNAVEGFLIVFTANK